MVVPREYPIELPPAARPLWAKSWPIHGRDIEGWLPLWQHLHDSAGIAGRLWDEWLPGQVKTQIADAAGGVNAGRALVQFLAGAHDLGKASPAFQIQVHTLADQVRRSGLKIPRELPNRSERPHGLAGQAILERWLVNNYDWTSKQARAFASVVGGHHGILPSRAQSREAATTGTLTNNELLGGADWQDVQDALVEHMVALTGAAESLAQNEWRDLPQSILALLLAIVVVCDWLASNQDLFPLVAISRAGEFGQPTGDDEERLEDAWRGVRLPKPWTPDQVVLAADELLRGRFDLPNNASIRPVQTAAVDAAKAMDAPGLLIIEAPMGEGKTEAAMLAAEIIAARTGAGGIFVALPTQATSDAMFARVMQWIAHQTETRRGAAVAPDGDADEQERRAVFLAHGKAWLNPDFTAIPRGKSPVRDVDRDDVFLKQQRTADGGAYIDAWMANSRKGILADFVVGTIDHVLFAALKARHVTLRHLAFARKVVILDEIHAYDAFMNVYLERSLEWLGAYGVPVIALSATLPAQLKGRLLTAYQRGLEQGQLRPSQLKALTRKPLHVEDQQELLETPVAPSAILTYRRDGALTTSIPAVSTRRRTIKIETASDDAVLEILADALTEGGCAVVIRNTVRRAQETYRELRTKFSSDEVRLLHSRFLASDRKAREAEFLRLVGKPNKNTDNRPHRLIVVATQVVEQSLDVDFDLLITDLAPIDLLLQRIGRLHRHEERSSDSRPKLVREPRAIIVGVENWADNPPKPAPGSTWVYGDYLLLRTAAQIKGIIATTGTIELPVDIAPLVQAAYDEPCELGPENWQAAIRVAKQRQEAKRRDQEQRASVFRLRPPSASGAPGLINLLDASPGEADETGARAQVRDSADSLEVLVVQTDGADQWRLPDWLTVAESGQYLDRRQIPNRHLLRALAGTAVRLPSAISGAAMDIVIDELERLGDDVDLSVWQTSPLLAGQLILPLDEERCANVGGWQFRYDPATGLDVEAINDDQAAL